MRSIYDNAVDRSSIMVQCVWDTDDPKLKQYVDALAAFRQSSPGLIAWSSLGASKSKIDAFNRELPEGAWKILVGMSDDMRFSVKGFDKLIIDYMPDDLDWFLHFHEKDTGTRCSVMSIVGRKYWDRDEFIYFPGYKSLWCDVEETEKARLRGRYLYIPTPIFIHLNPAYGYIARDEMFDAQQKDWHEDEALYNQRMSVDFYL